MEALGLPVIAGLAGALLPWAGFGFALAFGLTVVLLAGWLMLWPRLQVAIRPGLWRPGFGKGLLPTRQPVPVLIARNSTWVRSADVMSVGASLRAPPPSYRRQRLTSAAAVRPPSDAASIRPGFSPDKIDG